MRNTAFKAVAAAATALIISGTAQANDTPIELLLSEVNLDLTNPGATARRTIDRDFKSNNPSIRSRIFKLNDGTHVKLVGRRFDKPSDIDRVSITYPRDGASYKNSYDALTDRFGAASAKRPDILVWRLDNTSKSPSQSKSLKIMAKANNAEEWVITVDRRSGGRGNNPRLNKPKQSFTPLANAQKSQLQPNERD